MRRFFVNTFALSLLLIGSFAQASCQNKAKGSEKKQEVAYIRDIDASFMKEYIFDYEQNPTKFVYKGDKPAIIDFYADWCGPCRKLAPKLEQIVKSYNGEVVLYKINVDKNQELARQFAVESIPMVLFIPVQGTPYQTMGNLPEEAIKEYVEKIHPKKD